MPRQRKSSMLTVPSLCDTIPDRNTSPDAAARMTSINEAWEVLGDHHRRREYDALLAQPALHPDFASSILLAARDILLRAGWRVLEDNVKTLVLEKAHQKVRVVFLERVDNTTLTELGTPIPGVLCCLSVRVEGPVGPSAAAVDLVRSERYGAALPDGPEGSCRNLFAPFL